MHSEIEGPEGAADIVCLHGGLGTGRYHWSRQVDWMAERFRVHLPDLPGHGRSPLPPRQEYSRELLADSVEGYLKELGRPAHVLAFSMGGYAALCLAARNPGLFASLTLVGVVVSPHDGLGRWRERFKPERIEADYPAWANALSRLHEPLGGPDAWHEVYRRDSSSALVADVDLEALRQVHCPVLLARGDRDPIVTASQYAELRERWPQADEFVVPAGAHDVQLTRHQLFRCGLSDFLDLAVNVSN